MESEFDDIRPYRDSEVPEIMKRFLENRDIVIALKLMLSASNAIPGENITDSQIESFLRTKLNGIKTVDEFQKEIAIDIILKNIVGKTVDDLTCSGIENLSKEKSYIFISNHRDITLDSAMLNYTLYNHGFNVAEIAFGDNLLINEFVSDLIRINRSFIVKRDLPIMEQLKASKQLSRYIRYVLGKGGSIWIAQREGRAKDGNDFTNPAIITMIYLSQRDGGMEFPDYIKSLNIVPVSVSYEFDPCDKMKGWEIFNLNKMGDEYKKDKGHDLKSMTTGMTGYKGRVHYTFSEPLKNDYKNDKEVAEALDRAIQLNYRLWPSNYIAYDNIYETDKYRGEYSEADEKKFLERYERFSPPVRSIILETYSNAVKNREIQVEKGA